MISSLLRLFLCCLLFAFTTSPKLLAQPPKDPDQEILIKMAVWTHFAGSTMEGVLLEDTKLHLDFSFPQAQVFEWTPEKPIPYSK